MSKIKRGDYVDVRAVAIRVDASGDYLIVRLPGLTADHQITIERRIVQNHETRSPEAIAADAVCRSFPSGKS